MNGVVIHQKQSSVVCYNYSGMNSQYEIQHLLQLCKLLWGISSLLLNLFTAVLVRGQCDILSPCLNGGTCLDGDSSVLSYICICPSGYGGSHCEEASCSTDPCANGGTCQVSNYWYIRKYIAIRTRGICSCQSPEWSSTFYQPKMVNNVLCGLSHDGEPIVVECLASYQAPPDRSGQSQKPYYLPTRHQEQGQKNFF